MDSVSTISSLFQFLKRGVNTLAGPSGSFFNDWSAPAPCRDSISIRVGVNKTGKFPVYVHKETESQISHVGKNSGYSRFELSPG